MTGFSTISRAAPSRRSASEIARKLRLLATTAALVLPLVPAEALAQAADVEEVVVTATRIVREGYEAPTPTSVIGPERLATSATSNLAQFVTTLPAFVGSGSTRSTVAAGGAGTGGINSINMRSLGANRTLILVDGHRTTPAHTNGDVDINLIPQQLVSRIDVVTGGASAVYGSDAVAGVVNFILDKQFTGIRGEVSGGVTTYGDGENYRIALSGGMPFAGGRGHVLLSGEHVKDWGIAGGGDREWTRDSAQNFPNPAYGTGAGQSTSVPQNLILNNVGYSTSAPGGVIVGGPLATLAFGPGGVPYQQRMGDIVGVTYMRGGDWNLNSVRALATLAPTESRQTFFSRVAYDFTDNLNVHAQFGWNYSQNFADIVPAFLLGTAGPLITVDNAFLPESVRAQMVARNIPSIRVGTVNADLGMTQQDNRRTGVGYELGADGKLSLFGDEWRWDVYGQRGVSRIRLTTPNNISRSNYMRAVDAVRHPTTGAIVCRALLSPDAAVRNAAAGCSPWNPMGVGVNMSNGPGADYIHQASRQDLRVEQDVFAGSITGEAFSLWAGPVSLALSAEHRRNSADSKVDAGSLAADHVTSNFARIQGETKVTEGAIETVIPLLKDQPFAQALDFNGAVRFTDYSRAGFVTTWKAGLTFEVNDSIRLRGNRSRDIRAPNLIETFSPEVTIRNANIRDPFNGLTQPFNQTTIGNLNLRPEKADNTSIGAVLRPTFLPGVGFSVDWWDIKLKDAISTIGTAQTLNLCFDRTAPELCSNILRDSAGVLVQVISQSTNFALQHSRGIDFEASYQLPLDGFSLPGALSLHGNATRYLKSYVNTRVSPPTDNVGEIGGGSPPKWRATATASYRLEALTAAVTVRGFSGGTFNNNAVVCTSGCPVSTTLNPTINQNHLPGRTYVDLGLSYDLTFGENSATAFFNVRNLMDVAPGAPRVSGNALQSGANTLIYDVEGRTFRGGIRFRM